jgi:hypothetical protein
MTTSMGNFTVETLDYDDPFPFEKLAAFVHSYGKVFVVEADLGNDSINWVFSDWFIDELEAEKLAQEFWKGQE